MCSLNGPWEDDTNRALNLFHIEIGSAVKLQTDVREKLPNQNK